MLLDQLLVVCQFHRLHKRQLSHVLERLSYYKWNSSHIGVLTTLADEPKATAELAQLIGLSKQATSLCIQDLMSRHLVGIRSKSPHVRVQLVYLTADGWSFLSHWMDESTALDQRYADRVGNAQIEQVKDTLLLLTEALDKLTPAV